MSGKITEKPFWLRPPWMILFDVVRLHRIRPWDVKISHLLTTLIEEIGKKGFVDFTASGIALFSSATIYRMKSELLLELQEPVQPPPKKPMESLPPPIQLPYRYEYTSTTIENLVEALEEVLKSRPLEAEPKWIPIAPIPPMVQELDQFMVDVERNIEKMYQRITKLLGEKGTVRFSRITSGQNKLEAIRSFLLILFIASRGWIRLWQEEEFGEIYLSTAESFPSK